MNLEFLLSMGTTYTIESFIYLFILKACCLILKSSLICENQNVDSLKGLSVKMNTHSKRLVSRKMFKVLISPFVSCDTICLTNFHNLNIQWNKKLF